MKEVRKKFLQIKETGKDLTGVRREVEKQLRDNQHTSKEFKEFGREVTRIQGMGKEIASLRKEMDKLSSDQINTNTVRAMQEEIKALRQMVDDQQNTIQNLHKIKKDFTKTSHKTVGEINKLVEAQKAQVHEFRTIRTNLQQESQQQKVLLEDFKSVSQEIQKATQQQVQRVSVDLAYKKLKDQAFNNRFNMVIIGLPEHESNIAFSAAIKFLRTDLKIKKRMEVEAAYRIGQLPPEGSPYIRPLIVKFTKLPDRNLVWRQQNAIPQLERSQKIKIQADLPKQLRDDITILYRVARAASSMEGFQSASIKEYALNLNGKLYSAKPLEQLPHPIRPSLAVRMLDDTLVFFSKFCILSNHFLSTFKIQDREFHSVEHFLAWERAKISKQDHLIEKASKNHIQEWQERRADIAAKALRAMFQQNRHLYDFLQHTGKRTLGEASRDPSWGVGMTLDDEHIIDTSKRTELGNLLATF